MSIKIPKYRLHKGSGQALVQIHHKRFYLGKYNSEESKEQYRRFVAEFLAKREEPRRTTVENGISLNELILAFWRDAKLRYIKNGKPTSEICSFRTALSPLQDLYGQTLVTNFGPLALISCRQKLIEAGFCRKRINQHVGRVRQMFKWGVAREMVPEAVWRALCAVEGLRNGEAPDTEPVRPVSEEHIKAIEFFVTPQIWAMINVQLWTGCRPGEVCLMRGIDISMLGKIWEYRPHSHKTEHHDKKRVIFLGPHAQKILKPWLKTDVYAYLFSPAEGRAWYFAERARNRRTPKPANQHVSQRKIDAQRKPGSRYNVTAYGCAIRRACEKAKIPTWSPNQLRHTAATRIRSEFGIEAARILLGHSSAVTSEIYAEIDRDRAHAIVVKIG